MSRPGDMRLVIEGFWALTRLGRSFITGRSVPSPDEALKARVVDRFLEKGPPSYTRDAVTKGVDRMVDENPKRLSEWAVRLPWS